MRVPDGMYKAGQIQNEGFGLRHKLSYGNGYWVEDDSGVTIEGEPDERAILDAFRLMDIQTDEVVGVWTQDGITHIDRSYHFIRKEVAIDFGNIYNRKAIWDCSVGEKIRL